MLLVFARQGLAIQYLLRFGIPPLAVFLWLATAVSNAPAADLTLQTSAPPASPLVVSPADASRQLLVSVVNADATDQPNDFMTGWQFRLQIVPDANSFGTLQFNQGMKPTPYVFDSVLNLGAPSATVNGVFSALDTAIPTNVGVQIPTATGANLQSISFTPSPSAIGTFGIYAESSANSFWTDESGAPRQFSNIPSTPAMVRIADVFVNPRGDINRDGQVNVADIETLQTALSDLNAYQTAHPELANPNLLADVADVNGDGFVNNQDLQAMITLLANNAAGAGSSSGGSSSGGGTLNAVPEPSMLLLAVCGCTALLFTRRHWA